MYEKYLLQLEEAGKIRNLKERSINCYKNYVSYFLNYMGKNPEELTCQDVRDFLPAKKDNGLKATTSNLYNSAIRFFCRNVLHILWDDITVLRMLIEHKLPVVLSVDEIDRLLNATDDLKYKTMFATIYSSGMRVSEVIHLHYGDISRTNMQIHIRDAKNRMDRYTILSKRNLALLTEYWFACGKPRDILFPNKFTGEYLTVSSVEQQIFRHYWDTVIRNLPRFIFMLATNPLWAFAVLLTERMVQPMDKPTVQDIFTVFIRHTLISMHLPLYRQRLHTTS